MKRGMKKEEKLQEKIDKEEEKIVQLFVKRVESRKNDEKVQ